MRKERLVLAAAFALFAFVRPAVCKDFPEAVLAADPLAASSGPGVPAGMGSSFEYGNYAFSHDDIDSFYFRLNASPVIVKLGDSFALGGIFESTLMCGPIRPGTGAANIAAFWMNTVQFEYGLYSSLAFPGSGKDGFHLLAEYSRTSQHTLNSPLGNPPVVYSQVSYDFLILGIALPEFDLGPVALRSNLRLGYGSLLAFWNSVLAQPRMSWIAKPSAEVELPLGGCAIVARAYPCIFIDRYTGLLDADWFAEAGLIFAKGRESTELLLTLYDTRNSEMLDIATHPTFEAGIALRFSHDRARPPSAF